MKRQNSIRRAARLAEADSKGDETAAIALLSSSKINIGQFHRRISTAC
jgi:hypothetical protein